MVKNDDIMEKIHFQDVERVKISFKKILTGESDIYECMYRVQRKENQVHVGFIQRSPYI